MNRTYLKRGISQFYNFLPHVDFSIEIKNIAKREVQRKNKKVPAKEEAEERNKKGRKEQEMRGERRENRVIRKGKRKNREGNK
jgi:hypothetical protein